MKRWDITAKNSSNKWQDISMSAMAGHLERAENWARKINDPSLRAKSFQRLTDAAGRQFGDKPLAFKYLTLWLTAAKSINDDNGRYLTLIDIAQVVGGLDDRNRGLICLEEIASEMKRINNPLTQGWGFRFLAEAAGQLGAREQGLVYWHKAHRAADLASSTDSNEIYRRPLLPEAASVLMGKDASAAHYFNDSIKHTKTLPYGSDRAVYFGELAKTATLIFDTAQAMEYLEQFRLEEFDSRDTPAKGLLLQKLAEAAGKISDKEIALSYIENLRYEVDKIEIPWTRALAYQVFAQIAQQLGDNNSCSKYFTLAIESALQDESPLNRTTHISDFLLSKAAELEFDIKAVGILAKLDTAITEVGEDRTGLLVLYQNLATTASQLGSQEKGLFYLSRARMLIDGMSISAKNHAKILRLAETAKELGELSQAQELAQQAFDLAKGEIGHTGGMVRRDYMSTIAGVAKLNASIGNIQFAINMTEKEDFSPDAKAAIMGTVLAEYAENHYQKSN